MKPIFYYFILLLTLSFFYSTKGDFPIKGIVYGGDEWSNPSFTYDTSSSDNLLKEIAGLGTNYIRIILTWYQDYITSTTIYPITNTSTPLFTVTDSQLIHIIQQAHALKLKVFLAPILDPNWDIASNKRENGADGFVWRGEIGTNFTESDWSTWFTSYNAFILKYADIATTYGVELFEVASELELAFTTREQDWRNTVALVRQHYKGPVVIAAGSIDQIQWWDALDYIGNDAYVSLGNDTTVEALVLAWKDQINILSGLATKFNKSVLITELGYESRPGCTYQPYATPRQDLFDCSVWKECYDMDCQGNAYEAFYEAFTPYPWFVGNFWWLWRTDSSHGGMSDSDFTPRGKPASNVLLKWYNNTNTAAQVLPDFNLPSLRESNTNQLKVSDDSHVRGIVFGSSQWSAPYYKLDSPQALQSIDNIRSVGADHIMFTVQWYFDDINSTRFYPINNPDSFLRTDEQYELNVSIAKAQAIGLQVALAPILDPNYDLPGNCRGGPNCPTRNQLGAHFDKYEWHTWFFSYRQWIEGLAIIAELLQVNTFVVGYELDALFTNSDYQQDWADLITQIRRQFSGRVTVSFNGQTFSNNPIRWADTLDWIGLDCYFPLNVSLVNYTLPWQVPSVNDLVTAWTPYVTQLETIARTIGRPILCSNVGYQSKPYSWTTPRSIKQPDESDCSVWSQSFNMQSQANAYQALFVALWNQTWFNGVYFWQWTADPNAGGTSDDTFTPWNKPATGVLKQYFTA